MLFRPSVVTTITMRRDGSVVMKDESVIKHPSTR